MSDPVPASAFRLNLIVGEQDIDAQGHVSNVTVVQWFSRAAWKHSVSLGYDLDAYRALGAWFVVRKHEIEYHRSAVLGDALSLATWPSGLNKATAERRYRLLRDRDGELVAAGVTLWAFIDIDTGRPRRIPPQIGQTFDPRLWTTD